MKSIAFGPFEPDKAAYGAAHVTRAEGVIPSAMGYAPLPCPQADQGLPPLPGACRGAAAFHDQAGNPVIAAGTADRIYQLRNNAWEAIGGGYNLKQEQEWRFCRYGNTVIAVNGADRPQQAAMGLGRLAEFSEIKDAPVGTSVQVVKEFVVIGGVESSKVRWSAIGDPLNWPQPGGNEAQWTQADEQDFPDSGAAVAVTGAPSSLDMLVFTERAIHRGQYVGAPYFFQFDILDKGRGTSAPGSVVCGHEAVYFLSEEGFFSTNGSDLRNIGFERINNWFRKMADETRLHETRGVLDPLSGMIFWSFAGKSAAPDRHDHVLIYHPQLDRFSYAPCQLRALFRGLTIGRTLEELDSLAVLDKLPHSLDYRLWKGGLPGLCAFDPQNRICWFNGPAMAARIDTAEYGGTRFMLHGLRPLTDAAEINLSVLKRDFLHESAVEMKLDRPSKLDGLCHAHFSARYASSRLTIKAGQDWSFAKGCEILSEEEGGL